jgi:UDP-GlcNAc:undecaprenyl-phosphate GlcNAc-1-phosphate transferase
MSAVLLAGLLGGLLGAVIGTGVARLVAIRFDVLNHPNPINKDHTTATPYLGGWGIAAGVVVGLVVGSVLSPADAVPVSYLLGSVAFLVVGTLDDLHTFGAGRKIALQALAALLMVLPGELVRHDLTPMAVADTAFAFLWILGVVNAFNFIDVSDGLASSVAIVAVGLVAVASGHDAMLAVALVGAGLGFLAWNRPPARIFMGDAGSLFLGSLLAAYVLVSEPGLATWPFLAILGLWTAVPLFDMAFQTLVRASEGRAWYIAGPDSFAIHLRRAGASKWRVIAFGIGATAVAWLAGFAVSRADSTVVQAGIVGLMLVLAAAFWRWLLDGSARAEGRTPVALEPARVVEETHPVRPVR